MSHICFYALEHEISLCQKLTFFYKTNLQFFYHYQICFTYFLVLNSFSCSRAQINKFLLNFIGKQICIFDLENFLELNPQAFPSCLLFGRSHGTCKMQLMNQLRSYDVTLSRYLQHQIYKYICSFIKSLLWNFWLLQILLLLLLSIQ